MDLPSNLKDFDGEEFSSFYVYVGLKENYPFPGCRNVINFEMSDTSCERIISVCYIVKSRPVCGYLNFGIPNDSDQTISELFKNITHQETTSIGRITKTEIADAYTSHIPVILNTLIYLASGTPDLRQFKNDIRYQGTNGMGQTPVKKDRLLSTSEITLVGYGFMKEQQKTSDGWFSSPHLGWRRCGEGHKDIRLSFIKGSNKKWTL